MSKYITQDNISYFVSILKKEGKSDNTIFSYTTNINKLIIFLNGDALSKEKMCIYKKWLKDCGLKTRTINAYLSAANHFCRIMGWEEMQIGLEPLTYDDLQNPMQISVVNYKKLVYTAMQNNKERLAMMVQVLCHMNLRFCELKFFTVDALNKGYVEVIRKNIRIKALIPEMIISDLNIYIKNEKIVSGMIFCTKNGLMVNRSNFCKDLKKICIIADINIDAGSIQNIKNVVLDVYPYYKLQEK